jgi:hypothetical protein
MHELVRVNCRKISQNFSPAGVTSPFVAQPIEQALPATRLNDHRALSRFLLPGRRSARLHKYPGAI